MHKQSHKNKNNILYNYNEQSRQKGTLSEAAAPKSKTAPESGWRCTNPVTVQRQLASDSRRESYSIHHSASNCVRTLRGVMVRRGVVRRRLQAMAAGGAGGEEIGFLTMHGEGKMPREQEQRHDTHRHAFYG